MLMIFYNCDGMLELNMEVSMKIIIRRGTLYPDIIVVHPVDNDNEALFGNKVNLHSDDAYKAFKELLALDSAGIEKELKHIKDLIVSLKDEWNVDYSPAKESLISRVIPRNSPAALRQTELENLSAILEEANKMQAAGTSLVIEDRIAATQTLGATGGRNR